ncbi:methylated-DNA--[protein]-cysteine S-methyltransferase [Streptomyces sp. SHP 1-2]|uniref:methylated-DNA--[protein]-cysteine S-methyltransferase n=1 Tax=Streptomyces sp. SHP 1-2 TaxID=2769489 RepID=UPI002238DB96|nr:methylated-DNA--[protein]-cysteine S-methyltransferase [Streptomyces sp. SHP 1-2]MCW5254293.1 methylated-DNA--[protein]-cysteine S-methyltransferase [Streptomyces sp. SHP 1-2]
MNTTGTGTEAAATDTATTGDVTSGTTASGTTTGRTTSGEALTYWTGTDSPVGRLLLTADPDGAITSLSVPGQKGGRDVGDGWLRDTGPFREAEAQLAAYFAGELTEFRLPLRARGTAFRERVWEALDAVPYGETTTYGAIAARIGASRAAVRAVGGAIGANPLLILRPCHRVIGADGSMTGYAGGLERKTRLLALEGAGPDGPRVG